MIWSPSMSSVTVRRSSSFSWTRRAHTRRGPADGLRRGDVRAAGPLVLAGRPPLPPGRRTAYNDSGAALLLRRLSLVRNNAAQARRPRIGIASPGRGDAE